MPLNRCSSMRLRDSMVKTIYKQLFQFLADVMNETVSDTSNPEYIAILDIAGFGS